MSQLTLVSLFPDIGATLGFELAGFRAAEAEEAVDVLEDSTTGEFFDEYNGVLEELQPKAFIINAPVGLLQGSGVSDFNRIFRALRNSNYRVAAQTLNAADYGVPQRKTRLFLFGIRNDLELDPTFPEPFGYRVTIQKVLEGLPPLTEEETEMLDISHDDLYDEVARRTQGLPGRPFNLRIQRWDEPCDAISPSGGALNADAVIHPSGTRLFSFGELKRLCTFPDSLEISGSYEDQVRELGRSVPPLLMKAMALKLRQILEPNESSEE